MQPLLVLVTTAVLGVEVGWEPLPSGGHEYTIQIEPQLLGILERGTDEIFSEVPPEIDVRRYRITVGTGKLVQDTGTPAADLPAEVPARAPADLPDRAPPAARDDPFDMPPVEAAPPPDRAAPTFPSDAANTGGGGAQGENAARDARQRDAVIDRPAAPDTSRSAPPAELPPAGDTADPIEQATFEAEQPGDAAAADPIETQKPQLSAEPQTKPWLALTGAVVLLCCSLGANFYLGWIAWEARARYRSAVARVRPAS